METKLLELEGTSEEIQARLAEFAGQWLRVTIDTAAAPTESAPRKLSIEEKIIARFKDAPLEERAKVPHDLVDNLDHYVYGLPKK